MITLILLNAIPAALVIATLTLVCWLPSRLRDQPETAVRRERARSARGIRRAARPAWRAWPTSDPGGG